MTTVRRVCHHNGVYCPVRELEDRIEKLEAENASLRSKWDALFGTYPEISDHPSTVFYVDAACSDDLQIGSYFKFVADPNGAVKAVALSAGDDAVDGVVVDLSMPGRIVYSPVSPLVVKLASRIVAR